jgi:hypothetical protein
MAAPKTLMLSTIMALPARFSGCQISRSTKRLNALLSLVVIARLRPDLFKWKILKEKSCHQD